MRAWAVGQGIRSERAKSFDSQDTASAEVLLSPATRTSMLRWTGTPTANRAGGPDEDHEMAPEAEDDGSPVTEPFPVAGGCR